MPVEIRAQTAKMEEQIKQIIAMLSRVDARNKEMGARMEKMDQKNGCQKQRNE